MKTVHNDVLDAALAKIATCTRMTACSAAPADFAGIAAVALADVVMTAGDGNGDYTIADGDVSGRKLSIAQQINVDPDATGDATHVALDDGTTLLYVTETNTFGMEVGTPVTFPGWDIELVDPS